MLSTPDEGNTHATAGACQTIFIDVEKPEASTPVSADKANSGAKVALRVQQKVSTVLRLLLVAGVSVGRLGLTDR